MNLPDELARLAAASRMMDAQERVRQEKNRRGSREWYKATFGEIVGNILADEVERHG